VHAPPPATAPISTQSSSHSSCLSAAASHPCPSLQLGLGLPQTPDTFVTYPHRLSYYLPSEPSSLALPRSTPLLLPPIATIACGCSHTAAVARDHASAFAWGAGALGQLGLGSESNWHTPGKVACATGYEILEAACGSSHTLFLVSNGRFTSALECGATPFAAAPAAVALRPVPVTCDGQVLFDIVQIYAGAFRSAVVLENGRLVVWESSRTAAPRVQPFGGGEGVGTCVAAALGRAVSYVGATL
jgi:hypothetical protein